ncbi:DUF488 domain-containing protein [Arthrobacter sp. TS-15]|nr:DUF488 domain-containing protein [Arthrobacter sp. TS-15]
MDVEPPFSFPKRLTLAFRSGETKFNSGLAELVAIANESVAAIMCSEAVPWRCHRRLITDALIIAGVEVFDIMSISSTRQASMTAFARVENGEITYPNPEED